MRVSVLWGCVLAAALALGGGCKERKKASVTAPPGGGAAHNRLAPDESHARGEVEVARMTLRTRLEVPGMKQPGADDEVLAKARQASALEHRLVVSEQRGKLLFAAGDLLLPRGTELRYHAEQARYLLCDRGQKRYWLLSGAEVGRLLEGGPAAERAEYSLKLQPAKAVEQKVAGMAVKRTDGELRFAWALTVRGQQRRGKVRVGLSIWHTADKRLKGRWAERMIEFLTVPFQDRRGAEVLTQLKKAIGFPVKWSMTVQRTDGGKKAEGTPPRLVSEVTELSLGKVARADLAAPPAGYQPASGPYQLQGDGQTVSEEVLSHLPARQGAPMRPQKEQP